MKILWKVGENVEKSIKIKFSNGSEVEMPQTLDTTAIRGCSIKDFVIFDQFMEEEENETT